MLDVFFVVRLFSLHFSPILPTSWSQGTCAVASGGALVYFPFDPDALRMEAMLAQYRQAEPGQIEAKAVEHLVLLEVAPRGEWGHGLDGDGDDSPRKMARF